MASSVSFDALPRSVSQNAGPPAVKKPLRAQRQSFASNTLRASLGLDATLPLLDIDEVVDDGGGDDKDDPMLMRLVDVGDAVRSKDTASRVSGLDANQVCCYVLCFCPLLTSFLFLFILFYNRHIQ